VRKKKGDSYEDQYIFSLTGRSPQEFEGMCRYHQTSPESHFTKKRLCSLPFDGGRITLTGDSLKLTKGNETTETPIERDEEFNLLLREKFGIIL
jgi:N-hydroxyarylamine O-acetyltransferase